MNPIAIQCLPSSSHLHRTNDIRDVFSGIEADNLSAMPAIAEWLRTVGFDRTTVVVGPDSESEAWVSDLAARLELPHMAARKTRHGDRSVDIELPRPDAVEGRPVLLVDDLVSSGATLAVCARALAAAGAISIDAIVTHALFPSETEEELTRAGIRSIRSTSSVPHSTNAIALDALLAAALRREIRPIEPPSGSFQRSKRETCTTSGSRWGYRSVLGAHRCRRLTIPCW